MTKEERTKMYNDYLQGEGFSPSVDSDGDVMFKQEGRSYLIQIDANDEDFFRIIFPNFWKIENDAERVKVEQAAMIATSNTKVAKVFPVRDNVWAAVELFCSPADSFKPVFVRSMSALQSAVDKFAETMRS